MKRKQQKKKQQQQAAQMQLYVKNLYKTASQSTPMTGRSGERPSLNSARIVCLFHSLFTTTQYVFHLRTFAFCSSFFSRNTTLALLQNV